MRHYIYMILGIFLCASSADAASNPAQGLNNELNALSSNLSTLNVSWPQNSINYSQLQSLMAANPGISQMNIQFPNGTSWDVQTTQLQSMYQTYLSQAQKFGYTLANPDLSFSSVDNVMNAIPINGTTASMQMKIDSMVQELRYQQLGIDSLPDWLKAAITWMVNMLTEAYQWVVQAISPYLPNWR